MADDFYPDVFVGSDVGYLKGKKKNALKIKNYIP